MAGGWSLAQPQLGFMGGDASSLLPVLGDREGLRGFTLCLYPLFLFQEH